MVAPGRDSPPLHTSLRSCKGITEMPLSRERGHRRPPSLGSSQAAHNMARWPDGSFLPRNRTGPQDSLSTYCVLCLSSAFSSLILRSV